MKSVRVGLQGSQLQRTLRNELASFARESEGERRESTVRREQLFPAIRTKASAEHGTWNHARCVGRFGLGGPAPGTCAISCHWALRLCVRQQMPPAVVLYGRALQEGATSRSEMVGSFPDTLEATACGGRCRRRNAAPSSSVIP